MGFFFFKDSFTEVQFTIIKSPIYVFIWPQHAACGILVPRPGIEPVPPEVEAQSPNHRTAREVPQVTHLK